MRVKEKRIDEGTVQLNATATAEEVDRAFDDVEVRFARGLGLSPDPSKTVAEAIEEKLGIADADSTLASQAADELVPYAIDARNIIPANAPQPESDVSIRRGRPWSFRIQVRLKPHYELSSYEPVEVAIAPFSYDGAGVAEQMALITRQYPEFVAADPHPVGAHDICAISLEATRDGEPVPGLSTERRTLSLGRGFMPEDFEHQVVGMEPGQTKEFSFEAPAWDGTPDATETYQAKVTVLELQEEVLPEFTDEWVTGHLPAYSGVEDLRSSVRAELEKQARRAYDQQVEQLAQAALAERFESPIPDEAYTSTAANIKNMLAQQLQQQGKSLQEFMDEQGGEQAFNIGLMMQARQQLMNDYALDALFEHEGIEVTEADVMDACAEMNPQDPLGLRQQMEHAGRGFVIREIAQRYAAIRHLVAHAKIVAPEDAGPAGSAAPEQ